MISISKLSQIMIQFQASNFRVSTMIIRSSISLSSSLPSSFSSSNSSAFIPNSRSFVSRKGEFGGNLVKYGIKRGFCVASRALGENGVDGSFSGGVKGSESFLRSVLGSMETVYLNRNPTAKAILELVHSSGNDKIRYDHFAFRTFGVSGHGIDSMAKIFLDFGYMQKDELRFPAKKLRAFWFSPPTASEEGSGINGPLPRVFISELLVDQMSIEAQEIIRKYTEMSGDGSKYAAIASGLGSLTWERPLYSEFQQLARESEYAAWTLVNGYALNHVTISTHRLRLDHLRSINSFNQFIEENGFKLTSEGGTLKVSPDGLLLQSSTVADSIPFCFSDGITESVPCSYIEFAERLVLPEFESLPKDQVKEFHRRDGFEVGNADKIFESTSKLQVSRRA